MTEMSKSTYLEHAESFAVLFTGILTSLNELNSNLAYYTIITMNNLVPVIGGHQQVCNKLYFKTYNSGLFKNASCKYIT